VSGTADGYIRVSRRAGREGESFISPEVQRKKIADWAIPVGHTRHEKTKKLELIAQ